MPWNDEAEAPLPGMERAREPKVDAIGLGVEGGRAFEPRPVRPLGGDVRDRELDGVQLDLVRLIANLDLDGLLAGVRGGVEVGLEPDVVAARDDRPGQAMAVHVAPLSALRRRAPVDVGDGGPPGSHSRGAPEEDTIGGAVRPLAPARPRPPEPSPLTPWKGACI